ncbi:MAG: hypothetical protein AAFZ18_13310 [Myxococcota bacterium]
MPPTLTNRERRIELVEQLVDREVEANTKAYLQGGLLSADRETYEYEVLIDYDRFLLPGLEREEYQETDDALDFGPPSNKLTNLYIEAGCPSGKS